MDYVGEGTPRDVLPGSGSGVCCAQGRNKSGSGTRCTGRRRPAKPAEHVADHLHVRPRRRMRPSRTWSRNTQPSGRRDPAVTPIPRGPPNEHQGGVQAAPRSQPIAPMVPPRLVAPCLSCPRLPRFCLCPSSTSPHRTRGKNAVGSRKLVRFYRVCALIAVSSSSRRSTGRRVDVSSAYARRCGCAGPANWSGPLSKNRTWGNGCPPPRRLPPVCRGSNRRPAPTPKAGRLRARPESCGPRARCRAALKAP